MDKVTIILLVLLFVVLVGGLLFLAIDYKKIQKGEKSVMWEEVKDDENSSQK